ncbi:YbfB/YjiJ family MFS transporter [Burkholderia sp. Ac-20365]|uniref:YbfB/YjiJ family MFS transporter n=1 Tax=Burkholderia sp. Ac-20365 TaxID=2703897 RepID=UPI00197B5AA2|nr:YbfB/YjiJ family MFS transporter [Burkholderia sp. Ac-20365]MBN3765533.1 YbfB/YjiJ family MFS transporter [Burkholderia sp. Ac-20365]
MNDLASRTFPRQSPDAARRTALACMAALAVALGVGRFAFTPLLPLMLHGGELDIRHGGWLASLNYAGYFLGAITCVALRIDAARVVKAGLATTVLLVLAMGVTHQFWVWAAVRFVAGAVSAWTFVFASQWGLRRLAELGANEWGGVIYTGPGIGIAATGLLVSAAGGYGASAGWIGFGLVSAVLTVLVWRTFEPVSKANVGAKASPGKPAELQTDAQRRHAHLHRADAFWLTVLYGVPGFGYIITATFLPVIARAALPADSPWPDLFWPMFGAALVVGALAGARLPSHWDNRTLLAGCYVLQALGIIAGIVSPTAGGLSLGSALIGLPFTAITLFAMREARRLHGDNAAGLMGYATAAYGLGQIVGPLVAAPIAAHTGSFTLALWLAALTLIAGAVGLIAVAMLRPAHRV